MWVCSAAGCCHGAPPFCCQPPAWLQQSAGRRGSVLISCEVLSHRCYHLMVWRWHCRRSLIWAKHRRPGWNSTTPRHRIYRRWPLGMIRTRCSPQPPAFASACASFVCVCVLERGARGSEGMCKYTKMQGWGGNTFTQKNRHDINQCLSRGCVYNKTKVVGYAFKCGDAWGELAFWKWVLLIYVLASFSPLFIVAERVGWQMNKAWSPFFFSLPSYRRGKREGGKEFRLGKPGTQP